MLERTPPQFRELHEITMQTDTRDILAHAQGRPDGVVRHIRTLESLRRRSL